jgi:hypothetical protein
VTGRLPVGDRVLPGHHRAAHLGLVRRVLEVAVQQRTCVAHGGMACLVRVSEIGECGIVFCNCK